MCYRQRLARRSCRWPVLAVSLSLVVGLAPQAWPAGVTVTRQVKANKKQRTLGYKVDVDTRWSEQPGYRPVRVDITPSEPRDVERQFTVVLKFSAERGFRQGMAATTVEESVAIPPAPDGSTPPTTSVTISVPQTQLWSTCEVEFWEDGVHRPDLDIGRQALGNGWGGGSYGGWDEPLAMHINSQAGQPNFPQQNPNFGSRGTSTWSSGNQTFTGFNLKLVQVKPQLLPEQWIDLTSVDMVMASEQELLALVESRSPQWDAMHRWLLAGGNLWVTGVVKSEQRFDAKTNRTLRTDDWSRLTTLDRLLGIRPELSGASSWKTEEIGKSRPLGLGQVLAVSDGNRDHGGPPPVQIQQDGIVLWLAGAAQQTSPAPGQQIRSTTPEKGVPAASAAVPPLDVNRLSWDSRMGFDRLDSSSDFWNFIIPGVGRVPLYTFLGLMTGFVVLIGPLNYIYLRRRAKLHLMIVTVPLCAALVTAGLFSYALISDGLGVRVRVRSYTEIDQRRGEAVCWSRLCYYAGLAPSQGLTFSGDVAVLPVPADIDGRRESEMRQVKWTADGRQHLRSGWLRSRTLTQFYTARARASDLRLEFASPEGGKFSVTNHLGTAVQHLLATDADGQAYYVEQLANGAAAELASLESANEGAADGANGVSSPSKAMIDAFHEGRSQRADPLGAPNQARVAKKPAPGQAWMGPVTSRMEAGLAAALQQVIDGKFEPRTYIAIVDRSPETELGTPSADEEAGFHVIVGRW
jgi:hypothetical protein